MDPFNRALRVIGHAIAGTCVGVLLAIVAFALLGALFTMPAVDWRHSDALADVAAGAITTGLIFGTFLGVPIGALLGLVTGVILGSERQQLTGRPPGPPAPGPPARLSNRGKRSTWIWTSFKVSLRRHPLGAGSGGRSFWPALAFSSRGCSPP
jgi:hypothetical protein